MVLNASSKSIPVELAEPAIDPFPILFRVHTFLFCFFLVSAQFNALVVGAWHQFLSRSLFKMQSSLWETEHAAIIATFARSNMLNAASGISDERPADLVQAQRRMGRRDALEQRHPTAPPSGVSIVMEDDDEPPEEEEQAQQDLQRIYAKHEVLRAAHEAESLRVAEERAPHEFALDHTEDAAKHHAIVSCRRQDSLLVCSSALASRVDRASVGGRGAKATNTTTMSSVTALQAPLSMVDPQAWMLPSRDGDFETETSHHFEARLKTHPSSAARDRRVDVMLPLMSTAPRICDQEGAAAGGIIVDTKQCAHCASDLVKSPAERMYLRAGKELLEYVESPRRVEFFLQHFCDECVVHYIDAIITADWVEETVVQTICDTIKRII